MFFKGYSLSREDICDFIKNEVSESRTLDYKEQLPGNRDDDKREFLADISSFANASGGFIIYGISEKRDPDGKATGIPENANGLEDINPGAEILRMENIIASGIEPRIIGINIDSIDGFPKGPMIFVYIPKSWISPHMVTFKNLSRFFSRNNAGKYQLDVMEIRSAFLFSESLPEKIRRFRDSRIAKIIADETPIQLHSNPRIILHVLPISSFDPISQIDLRSAENIELMRELVPIYVGGWNARYNLDGYLNYHESSSYVQLFRKGAMEAVEAFLLAETDGKKLIPGYLFEQEIINSLNKYLKIERGFGFQPPIFVMLSITGIRDYGMYAGQRYIHSNKATIDRDVLILPETVIESYEVDIAEALRNSFDALWQAAGWSCSIYYADNGKRIQ